MVAAVRSGVSCRAVARQYRTSLRTVQYWVARAAGTRLERVDFTDRPRGPRRPSNRTCPTVEERVLAVRKELKHGSALGEYGAQAILEVLVDEGLTPCPSLRTISRILERNGALDYARRVRRASPGPGWYLPLVAQRCLELDSVDVIEGLAIEGGIHFEVLTAISLHGGLPSASIGTPSITAKAVVAGLEARWRDVGLPDFVQFDNDARFQGPHDPRIPDVVSRVVRLSLSLGVVAVFAPPRETGFQAQIENFNGQWQRKVWQRWRFEDIPSLQAQSDRYIAAKRARLGARIDGAPPRRTIPPSWRLNLQATPTGRIVVIRRTNDAGEVRLLERTFPVCRWWTHRLVRCEVDLDQHRLHCYGLRRSNPGDQPLLAEHEYRLKQRTRPFHE